MNEQYKNFVALGRHIANERGVNWDIELGTDGIAINGTAWNLTEMTGDSPPPVHWIRDLGMDTKTLEVVNTNRIQQGLPAIKKTALTIEWQDFIKAAILEQLFFRKNTTGHVMHNVGRTLRVFATAVQDVQPWEINAGHIANAYELAQEIQASGKLADLIVGAIKVIFDGNHIADAGQLYPTLSVARKAVRSRRSKLIKSDQELQSDLENRKNKEKLPENKAFWELVRIVFTEQPKSFLDFLRFAQVKVMVLCGLRVGEVNLLPLDWKRTRNYFDPSGRSAKELGGYAQSVMLRHFAEKQQGPNSDRTLLYETAQYIPEMFVEALSTTLEQVARATQPLRETLFRQVNEKRILPWFKHDQLVSAVEIYTYLTGNPILVDIADDELDKYKSRYFSDFNPDIFNEIRDQQLRQARTVKLNMAVYQFLNRLKGKINFYYSNGTDCSPALTGWHQVYFRIEEIEDYIRRDMPTKLSDTTPFSLSKSSSLNSWDLMFLMPKRALAEGRNAGLCDISRHYGIGRSDGSLIMNSLVPGDSRTTLFESYGLTDEDRQLSLNSHSLRHLQNTELFRLGVADTIITKRFNRRSVVQSYEYDHRSLAEELAQIDLPDSVEISLGEKAATVARMIKAGKAHGPIIQAFEQIQRSEGEDAAFEYLKVEVDGFHSTPYGHCLSSFTVDPCPKHLECFSGCRHISATDLPENRRNLIKLEGRLKAALELAESRPVSNIGRANQISHVKVRLEGVSKLLSSPAGQPVFPEGPDLSKSNSDQMSIFDDNEFN